MKRLLIPLMLIFLLSPMLSAEITFNQQPGEIYNLGENIPVSVTITTTSSTSGWFDINLVCGSSEENFYRIPLTLSAGEERTIDSSLPLAKSFIGGLKGECLMKSYLGDEFSSTEKFKISDLINLDVGFTNNSFDPGGSIIVNGEATKENGQAANGFIEVNLLKGDNSQLEETGQVNNGSFSVEMALPEGIEAGDFLLKVEVYEEDSQGNKTNRGTTSDTIEINQIPTSLEIVLESYEIEPGTNLEGKTHLYDQTGGKISSPANIIIKNSNGETVEKFEAATDKTFSFPIPEKELPAQWKISSESNGFEKESSFTILEKESIQIEIINETLVITNTGNVPYNQTTLIKIGDEEINLDLYLEYGEIKRYSISAPDGEYNVEVISGENSVSRSVFLTGKAVSVKEARAKVGSLLKNSSIWIFIVLILGFVVFIVYKRGYKRAFVGYISKMKSRRKKSKSEKRETIKSPLSKGSLVKAKNKAEFSLSIKGNKQDASIIAIHIKNLKDIQSKKSNAEETIQKLAEIAESQKALVYESRSHIFFILAPVKTKTFKNEKTALEISKEMLKILNKHNKMFRQKIDFGISLTGGMIIAKKEPGSVKFMSLGNLIGSSRKISSLAKQEILLGEKMNDKLRSHLKTEKREKGKIEVYSIKETKNPKEHEKFIRGFLDRLEKDKNEEKDKKG